MKKILTILLAVVLSAVTINASATDNGGEQGKIDTTPLITHRFPLDRIEEAYRIFENKEDGVIKIAVYN